MSWWYVCSDSGEYCARLVNGVLLLFLITIMHSDLIQFLFVFNIVVGMFAVTRDGMCFRWAPAVVLTQ